MLSNRIIMKIKGRVNCNIYVTYRCMYTDSMHHLRRIDFNGFTLKEKTGVIHTSSFGEASEVALFKDKILWNRQMYNISLDSVLFDVVRSEDPDRWDPRHIAIDNDGFYVLFNKWGLNYGYPEGIKTTKFDLSNNALGTYNANLSPYWVESGAYFKQNIFFASGGNVISIVQHRDTYAKSLMILYGTGQGKRISAPAGFSYLLTRDVDGNLYLILNTGTINSKISKYDNNLNLIQTINFGETDQYMIPFIDNKGDIILSLSNKFYTLNPKTMEITSTIHGLGRAVCADAEGYFYFAHGAWGGSIKKATRDGLRVIWTNNNPTHYYSNDSSGTHTTAILNAVADPGVYPLWKKYW